MNRKKLKHTSILDRDKFERLKEKNEFLLCK